MSEETAADAAKEVTPEAPARRRLGRGGVAIALVVGLILGSASMATASHSFPDVPDSNPFHDDIDWMADVGITTGFPDGTFKPGAEVTRQSMAAFMHRLSGTAAGVSPMVNAATTGGFTAAQMMADEARWAVVNANGTIARSSGGVTLTSHTPGAGSYVINFGVNVTGCVYNATVGLSGSSGTSARGFTTVVGAAVSVNAVFVTTDDINGSAAERGFHITVFC